MTYLLVVVLLSGDVLSIEMPPEVENTYQCQRMGVQITKEVRKDIKKMACILSKNLTV